MLTQGEANAISAAQRAASGASEAGAAFPPNPYGGQRFYRTDLADLFCYDAGRSKWLGVRAIELDYTIASALGAAGYWTIPGAGTTGASFGHVLPYDATCVGFSYCFEATPGSFNIVLRQNGTATAAGLATGGAQSASTTALNIDFDSGDVMGCRSTNATPTGSGHVRAVLRRRAT